MMKFLVYLFFRAVVALFSVLSFGAIYRLSDGIAWLLDRVIKYRRGVIEANLRRCIPGVPERDVAILTKGIYQNIADILVEAIKGFSMSRSAFEARYVYSGTTLPKGSFILMGSHLSNWEWGVITWPLAFNKKVVGIYKPLTNNYIEQYTAKRRSQFGHILATMYDTRAAFDKYVGADAVFMMLSDQNPTDATKADWVQLFGQDTACVQGADRYARRYQLPVYYFETRRVRRGHYHTTCELLCDNPSNTQKGDITSLFMDRLAEGISDSTTDWLWSHRRWKHTR